SLPNSPNTIPSDCPNTPIRQTEYGGGVRRRLMAVVGDWQCLVVAYGGCGNGGFSWLESAGVRWSVATVSGEMEKKMV
ncbi:hypothetical protein Tco_1037649, partial [Tanacetum coccineum]